MAFLVKTNVVVLRSLRLAQLLPAIIKAVIKS
nr:MAG TPA_asm: hypothetical protein [Caudoviricetes sp.]